MTIEVSRLRKMDTVGALTKIAKYQSVRVFDADFQNDENRKQRENDGLGCAIAHYTEWDGLQIMKIFAAALEDSNFHGECANVRGWIATEESKLQSIAAW